MILGSIRIQMLAALYAAIITIKHAHMPTGKGNEKKVGFPLVQLRVDSKLKKLKKKSCGL